MQHHLRQRLPAAVISLAVSLLLAAWPARGAPRAEDLPTGGPGWFEAYRQAVVHAELEEWDMVEDYAEEALRANPTPQRSVRIYGMWHTSYIPYYYLGLAQYRQGRYGEAMKSFRKEEQAGAIRHDPVAWIKMKKLMSSAGKDAPAPPSGAAAGSPPPTSASPEAGDGVIVGLEAFFKHDYDGSIAAFQEAMKDARSEDLTLHLYLGMAYAGKAKANPEQKTIWENLAFMEFQQVHRMDPGYTLSPGIFSEDMMALFEASGGGK